MERKILNSVSRDSVHRLFSRPIQNYDVVTEVRSSTLITSRSIQMDCVADVSFQGRRTLAPVPLKVVG